MTHASSTAFMVGLDGLMIAYTLWVLARAGASRGLRAGVAGALVTWLGALFWLFVAGPLPHAVPGLLFLGVIVGFVGFVGVVLLGVPTLRRALLTLDHVDLLLPQGIRVFFGASFLMQAALGVLPTTFGILDGFSHVAAGFLGLLAAYLVQRESSKAALWTANVFGLGDILVVASTLALVLLPEITPRHSMMLAVFLPAPIWAWLHVISIYRALREPRTTHARVRPAATTA